MQLEYDADTDTSFDVVGNTEGRTTYYQHETGTDQVKGGTTTAITANISSGDFDITQAREQVQDNQQVLPDLEEMVNFIMKIRRFIPDFISQTGNTQSYITIKKLSK